MSVVDLDFDKLGGLVPVVVQDYSSGEVLMVAFMNRQAWEETLKTRRATYWSRSRKELWVKGETSGKRSLWTAMRIPSSSRCSKRGGLPVIWAFAAVFIEGWKGMI